jgi:hypothetical protein
MTAKNVLFLSFYDLSSGLLDTLTYKYFVGKEPMFLGVWYGKKKEFM